MKKFIFVMAIVTSLISCSKAKDDTLKRDLTLTDFETNLTFEMTYDEIVEAFGTPFNDIGSGIHIYVYLLNDSTEIWVGYSDSIVYAKHVDENQNDLHVLIE